jgi:hypothetical protein
MIGYTLFLMRGKRVRENNMELLAWPMLRIRCIRKSGKWGPKIGLMNYTSKRQLDSEYAAKQVE